MKLFISKIEEGAKYQGNIYDWWITVETKNKEELYLFDYESIIYNKGIKEGDVIEAEISLLGKVVNSNEKIEYGKTLDFQIIERENANIPNTFRFLVSTSMGNLYIPSDKNMEKIYLTDNKISCYNYTCIDLKR